MVGKWVFESAHAFSGALKEQLSFPARLRSRPPRPRAGALVGGAGVPGWPSCWGSCTCPPRAWHCRGPPAEHWDRPVSLPVLRKPARGAPGRPAPLSLSWWPRPDPEALAGALPRCRLPSADCAVLSGALRWSLTTHLSERLLTAGPKVGDLQHSMGCSACPQCPTLCLPQRNPAPHPRGDRPGSAAAAPRSRAAAAPAGPAPTAVTPSDGDGSERTEDAAQRALQCPVVNILLCSMVCRSSLIQCYDIFQFCFSRSEVLLVRASDSEKA